MPQSAPPERPARPSARNRPDVVLIGFVGGTGGASTMMLDLAEGLLKSGRRPRVVVPAWDSVRPYADSCRRRGVEVELTPWLQEREPRSRAYHDALRLVTSYRAPVVHYHLCSNVMPGRYAAVMRWLRRGRTLATIHHPYDDPPVGSPAANRWAQSAGRLFDHVVCVSRPGLERQREYGVPAGLLRLIHNGIDLDRFKTGRGERVRAELGIGPAAPLIVVSARVAAQKRPVDAVGVLGRLRNSFPDAHLVFVGDGPLVPAVREAAAHEGLSSRVHLVGHRFDVPDWLAAATVWLLPTESEAFQPCLSVVEAMAAGCAVVTTRCPGDEGVLIDGENALLCDIGDVDGMASAVARVLTDGGLRQRLRNAAQLASHGFSAEAMVTSYLALYESGRLTPSPAAVEHGSTPPRTAPTTSPGRSVPHHG